MVFIFGLGGIMLIRTMNKIGLFLLILALTGCFANKSAPTSMVVFGDSLSDQGNLAAIVSHPLDVDIHMSSPPSSHNGHAFTNGLLTVEYLAKHYGIELSPAWHKESGEATQIDKHKNKASYANIFAINAVGIESREEDKNSLKYKELNFLIKILSDNIRTATLTGNNYAIANTTIASNYQGLLRNLFNPLSLPHQIEQYKKNRKDKNIDKTLFVIMIGGNDIMAIATSDSLENKETRIVNLMPIMVTAIKELQMLGAKKILVVGVPDVGQVPKFHGQNLAKTMTKLSKYFNQKLSKSIDENFSKEQVKWLSIDIPFANLAKPPILKRKACVFDVANIHFNPIEFLENGELTTKFINNCTQEALNNGNYFYYDSVHGTNIVYKELGKLLIQATTDFFNE